MLETHLGNVKKITELIRTEFKKDKIQSLHEVPGIINIT